MRFLQFTAAAVALVACQEALIDFAKAETEVPPFRTYDAEAFFATTSYSLPPSGGLAFSPDGNDILVSADETGILNAYALDTGGKGKKMLTESKTETIFAVSYFPDDARILYTSDEGGNELNHLFVRGKDGAEKDLTPGEKVKASFAGWSGARDAFYVQTNERDPRVFDLYRYDAESYERTLLFENQGGFHVADVSPDARYIALVKPRSSADSDIYLVDRQEGPEPGLITPHEGDIDHGVYGFTPDGRSLVYATDEHGEWVQAWTYDLDSGEKSPLVKADWDVAFVSFSPSGRYRVTGTNEDGRTRVIILDTVEGGELKLPDLPAGDLGSVRFSLDEDKTAFTLSSSTSPANVHVFNLGTGAHRQLTKALNPEISEAHLVEAEVVRYESFDGLQIPSILYKPKQASADKPVPALVWVHGGPGGQSRIGYSAAIQHLVNHGYAVLAANNRGSSGYGKTFYHLDDRKHGEVDLQDIVHAKRWLQGRDWVDGEKIGIIGGSYGGYMVGAALAFEPEVFDIGINIFGVMNWVRTLESIPPWWEAQKQALFDELGDPATDAERHRRISPLFHAQNIQVPLLVVQGANDPRVLQVESDEIVEAVRKNEVPVQYLVFPDEGHGFSKRENRIAASNAYIAFLDTYLKGEGGDPARSGE